MSASPLANRDLHRNRRGFLADFATWDREVAMALAAEEGLKLRDKHWAVLEFLRDYFAEHDFPPSPRVILQGLGERLTRPGVAPKRRDLETLFPNGGCKQACRLAGLPDYYCHSC